MGILIDTSVIIASERGLIDLGKLFQQAPDEQWCIAAITASELFIGVLRADESRKAARTELVERIVSDLAVIPFDLEIAKVHAELSDQLRKLGTPVGLHDLMIAATALARKAQVATRDLRSFPKIPGLQMFDCTT